ncbi:MAG TPA: TetR family transcriptional regulator [Acidimicrobiia bacterium]|nr:TetR family transcriptional regulator [Acidimicrobiia bacterium]
MSSTAVAWVEDLTTKARIRDAALARFPTDGFAASTIRAIAADAGVSPGLVLHHFGSKDGLREACDRYVVSRFRETKRAALEDGNLADPGFAAAAFRLSAPIMRYLAWALARGHTAADELFDEMLEEATAVSRLAVERGLVVDSPDLARRTALQAAMQLGMVVLHRHLQRNLGFDPLSPQGIATITPTLLEIFAGLFTPEAREQIARTYVQGARLLP